MKAILFSVAAVLMVAAASAQVASADELDPRANLAPQGLIVRKSEDGKVEVFKADAVGVRDEKSAANAAEKFATPENKIKDIKPVSELDRVSSDESWYYWYNYGYSNWNYGCYWHGYYYNYYNYYSWSYGGYYYYYYRY